jgi:hypothetical protein
MYIHVGTGASSEISVSLGEEGVLEPTIVTQVWLHLINRGYTLGTDISMFNTAATEESMRVRFKAWFKLTAQYKLWDFVEITKFPSWESCQY